MNKSYYFTHDYNASNDAKVLFLRQQLGMEGYGIYWFIVEQLAQSGGFLPLKIIPVLAMQSQTQETKVKAVIEGYELFEIDAERFFSIRLLDHLNLRKQLSDKGKEGASKRWLKSENSPPNSPPISTPNAKERKESKEIKESKESKESETLFSLEHCLFVAMNDETWVMNSKANEKDLQTFIKYLKGTGVTEKHIADFKKHFFNWKRKKPDELKTETTIPNLDKYKK
jgi:hypothetical protein